MKRYVYTYKTPLTAVRSQERTEPIWPELAPECSLLKIYEVNDDGTLTEYVKPERMFAQLVGDGMLERPKPQSNYYFDNFSDYPYYEVMPNGDYRKISEEERKRLHLERVGK